MKNKIDYTIENGIILNEQKKVNFIFDNGEIDLLNLPKNNFRNYMFLKIGDVIVSKLQIVNVRGYLEIEYETNKEYENKGYMHILLEEFIEFMKYETNEDAIYALITNNDISEKILNDFNFKIEFVDNVEKWYKLIIK